MHDMRVRLSTLWVFALFNYLYADVITLFDLVLVQGPATTETLPFQITQGFLFGAAVLMEIAIVMVVLSLVLNYRANRWANIIAGVIQTAAVLASMFVETPTHTTTCSSAPSRLDAPRSSSGLHGSGPGHLSADSAPAQRLHGPQQGEFLPVRRWSWISTAWRTAFTSTIPMPPPGLRRSPLVNQGKKPRSYRPP